MMNSLATVLGILFLGSVHSLFAAAERSYEVRGVVREVRTTKKQVVIRHEEIKGYMEAMVMPFNVHDTGLLKALHEGDSVVFTLKVTDADDWIESIKVIARGESKSVTGSAKLTPLKVGDAFPFRDYHLSDEKGAAFNLERSKGRPMALTFFYLRCPFPTMCPLLSAKFAKVQALMAAEASAPANWMLLSVSIDPAHDTPALLNNYARQHKADAAHWKFARGPLEDIMSLAQGCGVNFWEEGGLINHSLRTVVIGVDGRVRKIHSGNDWAENDLAQMLLENKR